MRVILTILTMALSLDSFGQVINGTISFIKDNNEYNIVWVTAKAIKQTKDKESKMAKSDSLGHFKIEFEESGQYQLSVNGPFEPDTTFLVDVRQSETLELTISYPPKICPYEKSKMTGICPEGNHKDYVIPIEYGLIVGDEEFMKKVKNNEVELGGCMVTDCDPNWYCTTHDRRF